MTKERQLAWDWLKLPIHTHIIIMRKMGYTVPPVERIRTEHHLFFQWCKEHNKVPELIEAVTRASNKP
jgi:hypothetical protein